MPAHLAIVVLMRQGVIATDNGQLILCGPPTVHSCDNEQRQEGTAGRA